MRIGTVNLLKPSPVEMGHPKSIIQALAFRLWIWALNDINRVWNLANYCWQVLLEPVFEVCIVLMFSHEPRKGECWNAPPPPPRPSPTSVCGQKLLLPPFFPPSNLQMTGLIVQPKWCPGWFCTSLSETSLGEKQCVFSWQRLGSQSSLWS